MVYWIVSGQSQSESERTCLAEETRDVQPRRDVNQVLDTAILLPRLSTGVSSRLTPVPSRFIP
jgi:hypothetical protein